VAGDEQPQPTWWDLVKEEAIWLLRTMGVISLTLAIGRAVSYLTKGGGIDPNVLSGNWQKQVEDALRKKEGDPKNGQ
jgi:hypothetical protein